MENIDPSFEKLFDQARHLRDHMLRLSGHDAVALSIALRPIERSKNFIDITDDQITNLSTAFQNAHDAAALTIDKHTLSNILAGKSPHHHPDSAFASFGLAIMGFILVVATFHFTLWSNRTENLLAQAESFVEFDHNTQMMRVIELENLFSRRVLQPASTQVDADDIDSEQLYLEERGRLEVHYDLEEALPGSMLSQRDKFNPIKRVRMNAIRQICGSSGLENDSMLRLFAGCQPRKASTISPPQLIRTSAEQTRDPTSLATYGIGFQDRVARFEVMQYETMGASGRTILNPYATSSWIVQTTRTTLVSQLSVVRLWTLPILYGALGSIVFCVWRVLDTNISGLGLSFAIMRTGFAGLAALTFSMLLVPANVLAIGAEINRPIIYLFSFIFGYSIEAFISTLNIINTYVSSSMKVKDPRPPAAST